MWNEQGSPLTNHKDILKKCVNFYKSLYTPELSAQSSTASDYLSQISHHFSADLDFLSIEKDLTLD